MMYIWLSDYKKKDVCWNCNNYTTVLIIGINGLCWRCLESIENYKNDNDNDDNDNEMEKEPFIGRRLKPWLEYISENNPTTSNHDKMYLAKAIAEDLSSTFDRIDNCGK